MLYIVNYLCTYVRHGGAGTVYYPDSRAECKLGVLEGPRGRRQERGLRLI